MTFNEFLQNYGFYLALVVFFVIIILLIVFLLIPRLQKGGDESPNKGDTSIAQEEFRALLGGEENIVNISLRGSRLSVVLNDHQRADIETLKKHGVSRVIVMQNKVVLLVDETLQALFNELR